MHGFLLGDLHAPLLWSFFQIGPLELATRARLELAVQRLRVVVVDQQQRLARQQFVEAAKDGGVALLRGQGANVNEIVLNRSGSHFKVLWSEGEKAERKNTMGCAVRQHRQPSLPSVRVRSSQGVNITR